MKIPRLRILLVLPLALSLSQCGKKESPGKPGAGTGAAAPAAAPQDLTAHAAKLGFAGRLPADTEFYVGSANLKQHLEALKRTAFYKDASALANDKTPAPAAGSKSMKTLQKLWGDEFFIAGGHGLGTFSEWFRVLNRFSNEMNFRVLMTGGAAGLAGKAPGGTGRAPNPAATMLQSLLSDPTQIERASSLISQFQMPPLLIGFKVAQPAEVARDLIPEEILKKAPADKVTVATVKTPDGSTFQSISTEGGRLLSDEVKQQLVGSLPPTFNDQARAAIGKALGDFQAKKFAIGWGAVGDYLILACGQDLSHVKFAATPSDSLLSRAELAPLAQYAGNNLLGLVYANAAVLTGLYDDQPFTPMLRGVIGAMKESPVFGNLGTMLERQLAEYTPAESALFKQEITAASAALWWDRGLHMEGYGGPRPRAFGTDKPLQYARIIDQPGVILGVAYQRNLPYEQIQRKWMEKLFDMVYTAVQELVKAGIAGPQGGQNFAMFEQVVVPALKKFYEADKEMADKGLGGEIAFVLDVNGKMPVLPGLPPEAKDLKFPRITSVSEVANRPEVAAGWKKMNDALSETAAILTGGGGTRDRAGAAASAPAPGFGLPEPISSEKNGVTSYFYALPFFSGDLLPCASINDRLLMISTSKDCAEAFAAELAKPAPQARSGVVWRIDPAALADFVFGLAKLAPNNSAADQKEMKQVQKWVTPFHAMEGHMFIEKNTPRTSFSWEITDLVSFD